MKQTGDGQQLHAFTIGAMQTGLRNMAAIMDKAKASGMNPADLLAARLHPEMFNLLQQLQYLAYLAVEFARHCSGSAPPRVGYDEAGWEELRQSLMTAADYLAGVSPATLGAAAGKIVPTFMDDKRGMRLEDYGAKVMVPDFYFHMVIAYGLLRHKGISIGKADFLGPLETVSLAT